MIDLDSPQVYWRITVGGALVGLVDGGPINFFNEAYANDVRHSFIADLIDDGTMPLNEARSLVKVIEVKP